MPERTLADLQAAYLTHLQVERDATAGTLAGYAKDFKALSTVLPLDTPLSRVTVADIRTWLASMQTKSRSTRRRRIGTLKLAFAWAIEEGWATTNPVAKIRVPKALQPPPPTVPSFEQIQALLAGIGLQGRYRRRDLAAFSLCYSAALREQELCALTIGDVDIERRSVRVFGKGRKIRVARFDEATQQALRAYLHTRPDRDDPTRPLILSQRGRAWTPTGMRECLERHVQRLKIPGRIWVHGLRHARATHLYQATQDLAFVQRTLGHANPQTTMIYTHIDFEKTYDSALSVLTSAGGQ